MTHSVMREYVCRAGQSSTCIPFASMSAHFSFFKWQPRAFPLRRCAAALFMYRREHSNGLVLTVAQHPESRAQYRENCMECMLKCAAIVADALPLRYSSALCTYIANVRQHTHAKENNTHTPTPTRSHMHACACICTHTHKYVLPSSL